MKYLFLRRVLTLALCACLAVTLLTVLSPARSIHAATTNTAACSNLNMFRGKTWYPGNYVTWHTCKGTSLKLIYQNDGNFVLYIGGHAKWASNTSSKFSLPDYVQFQSDGNLVVYGVDYLLNFFVAWASNTNGKSATRLSLQDDGNLVIYTAAGKVLWASHTSGY